MAEIARFGQIPIVQADYELREARSEIARHHKLITELREGLEWTLDMILYVGNSVAEEDWWLQADDQEKYDYYRKLLNRQVS